MRAELSDAIGIEAFPEQAAELGHQFAQGFGAAPEAVLPLLADAGVGLLAGALVLGAVSLAQRLRSAR